MGNIMIAIKILLGISIFILIYNLFKEFRIRNKVNNFLIESEKNSDDRKLEYQVLIQEYGTLEKLKFKYKIDTYLIRSGLKDKFTFLNAEIYIAITIVIGAIAFIFSYISTQSLILSVGNAILSGLVLYLILYVLKSIMYEKIDNQIMVFLNMLDNFATSTDDIVSIFEQSSRFVEYPLNKYCDEFVAESRTTGNIKVAFSTLENKIENEKLKDIIKNLEISNRNDANYKTILDKSKDVMKGYFETKETLRSIRRNGQFEIVICLVMGLIIVVMMKGIIPNLITNLFVTGIGNIILIYIIAVLIICLWSFISLQKN